MCLSLPNVCHFALMACGWYFVVHQSQNSLVVTQGSYHQERKKRSQDTQTQNTGENRFYSRLRLKQAISFWAKKIWEFSKQWGKSREFCSLFQFYIDIYICSCKMSGYGSCRRVQRLHLWITGFFGSRKSPRVVCRIPAIITRLHLPFEHSTMWLLHHSLYCLCIIRCCFWSHLWMFAEYDSRQLFYLTPKYHYQLGFFVPPNRGIRKIVAFLSVLAICSRP